MNETDDFFTAEAIEGDAVADSEVDQFLADDSETHISGIMSISIIDVLEVIYIHHHDSLNGSVILCFGFFQVVMQFQSAAQACQIVIAAVAVRLLVQLHRLIDSLSQLVFLEVFFLAFTFDFFDVCFLLGDIDAIDDAFSMAGFRILDQMRGDAGPSVLLRPGQRRRSDE